MTIKLKPEIKEKWVAALESGKYMQGKGRLCEKTQTANEYKYCCWGIFAIIVGLAHNEEEYFIYDSWTMIASLRPDFLIPFLIPDEELTYKKVSNTLRGFEDLNDSGYPFLEIAKKIKSDL